MTPLAPIAISPAGEKTGKRFLYGPLFGYTIDVPISGGCGLPGSAIQNPGGLAYCEGIIKPRTHPGQLWRKNVYLWHDQDIPSIGYSPQGCFKFPTQYASDSPDEQSFELVSEITLSSIKPILPIAPWYIDISIRYDFIFEPYDPTFSYLNLPSTGASYNYFFGLRRYHDTSPTGRTDGVHTATVSFPFSIQRPMATGTASIYGIVLRVLSITPFNFNDGYGTPYNRLDQVHVKFGPFNLVGHSVDPNTYWPKEGWFMFWDQ